MRSEIIDVRGALVEVCENGDIYSVPFTDTIGRFRPRKLKGQSNSGGYPQVGLYATYVDGRGTLKKRPQSIRVHRLVAQAFLLDWREDWHVDHIDMDKGNNHVSNLRMMSPLEHLRSHSFPQGRLSAPDSMGSLEWVEGMDDVYYEKRLDSYAYLFKHGNGFAYGGYFETAVWARMSSDLRKLDLNVQ